MTATYNSCFQVLLWDVEMFRISVKTGSDSVLKLLLCSLRPTFKFRDNYREIMERLVEENLTYYFCSICKRNIMLVSMWNWVRSVDELPKHFRVRLTQLKPSCFIAQQLLLNIDYVILKILLQFLRVWWTFCCIWQSCQPSISLCQLSAMSIGPTHLLVFVC